MAHTDAWTSELHLTRSLKNKPPRLRNNALVDNSILTKKHAHTPANKHPPDGSARTTRGLRGYTRGCAHAHPPTK